MGTHMKTTIEIADALLTDAKETASREKTTVRALVEEGLRDVLDKRSRRRKPFRLRNVTFKGKGLQPHLREAPWSQIRDLIYEGRGS